MLGVVAGGVLDPRFALALCLLLLVVSFVTRRTRAGRFCLIAAALLLGGSRAPHDSGPPTPEQLSYYNGRQTTVSGQVAAEPDIRDTGANYVVAVRTVTVHGRTLPVSGRLELHTSRGQRLEYGDEVQLTGLLQTPVNSPTLNYRDILLGRGIGTQMEFPRAVDLGVGSSGYLGWIVPFREYLERGIDRSLPEPEAALLIAITLGAHSASLGTLAPVLVSTGLIHLIAISGIKVAMVAGTVWALLVAMRRRRVTLPVSLAIILFYVLLTGATASGERSALMWSLVFIASYLGRGTVALVSLAFVAALMVAADPLLPWDVGFQLSTIGTFSIVALSGPLLRVFRFVPSPFREALAVTLAAQFGTVPIVAAGFHSISFVGPIANALVLPLLPLTITLGFLLGLLSTVDVLAAPLSVMAYAATHAVVWLSQLLAGFPAALPVSSPTGTLSLAYYAGLAWIAWLVLRRAGWAPVGQWGSRAREVTLALLLVASAVTVSQADATTPDRLTFLGSGTSWLLQSDGRTAIIDGSPHPLALLSALGDELRMRARSIDLVVVTDPRSSNVAGLLALLDHYHVKAVLDVGAEYPSRTYADWRRALQTSRIPVYRLHTGATARIGHVTVRALAPDAICYSPPNCAGILHLNLQHRTILLASHAGNSEQENLVFHRTSLRSTDLVLGNFSHASLDLIHAVGPRHIWCVVPPIVHRSSCTGLAPGESENWPM